MTAFLFLTCLFSLVPMSVIAWILQGAGLLTDKMVRFFCVTFSTMVFLTFILLVAALYEGLVVQNAL